MHRTSRPRVGTWRDVGLASIAKLSEWVRGLPPDEQAVIAGLQLANEPALNTDGYDAAVKSYYELALNSAREILPDLPLVLSFIPPNDYDVPAFVSDMDERFRGAPPIIIDHRTLVRTRSWVCTRVPSPTRACAPRAFTDPRVCSALPHRPARVLRVAFTDPRVCSALPAADWYLNWAAVGTLPWSDLHRRACHEAANSWSVYTQV